MIMLPPPADLPPPPPNPDDNPRGRPKKLTLGLIKAFAALLSTGNYRCVACKRLHIGTTTFKRWMRLGKDHPDGLYGLFRSAVLVAETEAETQAVEVICDAGELDPVHKEWFLERKYPQRWGRYRGELGELKRRVAQMEKALADETPAKTAE